MRTGMFMCALIVASSSAFAGEKSVTTPIGKTIQAFTLSDYRGKSHSLADNHEAKLTVVAFLGTECPLAKLYAPRLAELAKQYSLRGVAFFGVVSNQQDSVTELAAFARIHGVEFPLVKDLANAVADDFCAQRTPEVFVLDKDRVVCYRGRIDDQYGITPEGAGYQLPAPRRRDLAEALEELLAGKSVSQPLTDVAGCRIGRVRQPDPTSDVTFSNQVSRILNANCVYCHRPSQIAPFSLTRYEEVVGWAEMILEVVDQGRMPPWHADPAVGHFANDARLSDADKATIRRWVQNGAPEGDPAQLPAPHEFHESWSIPTPDQVVYMSDEPFTIPAEGVVEYQEFVVDPGWTEDRWIAAIEPRPENRAVVHHILVFVIPPKGYRFNVEGKLRTEFLAAFAPGYRQTVLPEGTARFVPAASKLVFQMHYTPIGTQQQDRSCLGIKFADARQVRKEIAVGSAGNYVFRIPPQAPNHEVEAEYTFRRDSLLMALMPHMHLRGKDFRYVAHYPDGRSEDLLNVPRYDFGWQTLYQLAEPKVMPKGTRLHCVAHFDNSADNLNNPDPSKEVAFGDQTWEEMMIGFFEMAILDQDLSKPAVPIVRTKEFLDLYQAQGVEFDENLRFAASKVLVESPELFDGFAEVLEQAMPQLDRVCITYVDGDKLRVFRVEERDEFRGPLRSTSTVVAAEGQALADYAAAAKPVLVERVADAAGSAMQRMAKNAGARSSLHIPIQWQGRRGTLNLWSIDDNAFPPEAVHFATRLAELMQAAP